MRTILLLIPILLFVPSFVFGETQTTSIDTSYDVGIKIESPTTVIREETFPISFFVTTDSSYNPVTNITISIEYPEKEL